MNRIVRKPLVGEVEEVIGRALLFRTDGSDTAQVGSIMMWHERTGAAPSTIREAFQRLLAVGLVQTSNARVFNSEPLHFSRRVETVALMLRCARSPDERRVALRSWLDLQRFILVQSLPAAIGSNHLDAARLEHEMGGLCTDAFTRSSEIEVVEQELFVTWLAARVSRCEPLAMLANSLARGFEPARPWLAASVQHLWLHEQWTRAGELFELARREALAEHMDALMKTRTEQALAFADADHPRPPRTEEQSHAASG